MTPTCTRCHAEPRHGSSELGVRCLWPEPKREPLVASYRQAAGLDPMQAFPSDLRMYDADDAHRPAPPCCARVGSWWCLREAGHEPPCWTPHTREVTTPAIERGTRSPR